VEKKTLTNGIAELDGEGRFIITKAGKSCCHKRGLPERDLFRQRKRIRFLVPDEKTPSAIFSSRKPAGGDARRPDLGQNPGGSQGLLRAEGKITLYPPENLSFIGGLKKARATASLSRTPPPTDDVFIAGKTP
jgi:hypothetical protein